MAARGGFILRDLSRASIIKDYGFKDQVTRSALSIASNIAEGEGRETPKDNIRFLFIARGSAAEFITQLYIGIRVGFIE